MIGRYLPDDGFRILRLTGAMVALVLLLGANEASADLFRPASTADARTAQSEASGRSPMGVPARERLVRLDPAVLARHLVPSGTDLAPNRAERAQQLDGTVLIRLFPDVAATFRRSEVEALETGGVAWTGDVAGRAFSTATLVISNDQITGMVQLGRRVFSIEPVSKLIHRIIEIDPNGFPPEHAHPVPQAPTGELPVITPPRARLPQDVEPQATAGTRIRVLVAYTQAAAAQSPNIVNDINLAIVLGNQALARGATRIRLVLTRATAINYNEGTDFSANLNALTSGSRFDRIRQLRTRTRSDLVALLRKSGGSCGIAWYLPNPSAATKDYGFSVIARNCITNHSFIHELGHNMGLRHDRYVNAPAPNSEYNFGYVNLPARIRSIMAYNDQCAANGVSCTRVNFFSSPRRPCIDDGQSYGCTSSTKIGVRAGRPGAADAARRLSETRTAIGAYLDVETAEAPVPMAD